MIAIPNMEKPKSCFDCFAYDGEYLECRATGECVDETFYEKVRDDCPLIDLVRCGECKWSYIDERDGLLWCKIHMSHYRVNDDGFCSDGERRADEK